MFPEYLLHFLAMHCETIHSVVFSVHQNIKFTLCNGHACKLRQFRHV